MNCSTPAGARGLPPTLPPTSPLIPLSAYARASYPQVQTGRKIVPMSHTPYYYAPGGKYVLFLDLLGFTAFVRSSFQKKAEETDDHKKEFELAQK